MKVIVDQGVCIGCGQCTFICPKVFEIDAETGKSQVISSDYQSCDIQKAIDICPVDALSKQE